MDDKKIPDWSKFAPSNFSDIRGLISSAAAFISALIVGHIILKEYTKTLFYKIDFSRIEISLEKQIPFYIIVILVGFLAVFTNYFLYRSFEPNTWEKVKLNSCLSDTHMLEEKNHLFLYISFSFFVTFCQPLILLSPAILFKDQKQLVLIAAVIIVIVEIFILALYCFLYCFINIYCFLVKIHIKNNRIDSFKLLSKWLIWSGLFQAVVLITLLLHQNCLFDFLYRSDLFQWIELFLDLYVVFILPGFIFGSLRSLSGNWQLQSIGDWLRDCFERVKNKPAKTCITVLTFTLLFVLFDYMVSLWFVPVHQTLRFDRVTTITQREGSTQAYFIAYETNDKYCLEPAEINEDTKKIVVYTTVQVWIDKNGVLTTQISSEDKSKYTIETSDDNPAFKLDKIYHIDT